MKPKIVHKPTLGTTIIAITVTAIVSGWALKFVSEKAKCSFVAFSLFLLHSILGILRFTHPNINETFCKIYIQIGFYTELIGVPLIVVDALNIRRQLHIAWLIVSIMLILTAILTRSTFRGKMNLVAVVVFWNVATLAYLAFSLQESYWTVGMVILILLNRCIFQQISTYYDIPLMEITTVGVCFFVIFALNSLNEIVANTENHIVDSSNNIWIVNLT